MTQRAMVSLPVLAGVLFLLLWVTIAHGYLFRPGLVSTLLGVSLSTNVALAGLLLRRRRAAERGPRPSR